MSWLFFSSEKNNTEDYVTSQLSTLNVLSAFLCDLSVSALKKTTHSITSSLSSMNIPSAFLCGLSVSALKKTTHNITSSLSSLNTPSSQLMRLNQIRSDEIEEFCQVPGGDKDPNRGQYPHNIRKPLDASPWIASHF